MKMRFSDNPRIRPAYIPATNPIAAQATEKQKVLSYVFLHRMYRLGSLLDKSKTFNKKYRGALAATLKGAKKDSWTAVPSVVGHYVSMKYYEKRTFSVNGKIDFLAPKVINEAKLSSFVQKQKFPVSLLRKAGDESIYCATYIAGTVAGLIGFTYAARLMVPEMIQAGHLLLPVTVAIATLSVFIGFTLARYFRGARKALELGAEQAQKLVDDVKKRA